MRIGQRVLQAQPGLALLRRLLLPAFAFVAGGVRHRVRLVEDDDAVVTAAKPVDDLLHAARLLAPRLGAQGRVGREEDAFVERDRHALAEARQRHNVGAVAADRGPVAFGILDQLVGFGDPERAEAAPGFRRGRPQPVVENDRRDLAALAGAGTVTEEPAAPEAHGVRRVFWGRGDEIISLVDGVGAGEMARMRLAGIDDALELRQRRFRPPGGGMEKHGGGGQRAGAGDRPARRHQAGDLGEQFGRIGGHAGRGGKGAGVLGRNAVDDGEPRLHCRAVAGISPAGDRRREDNAGLLLQAHEALAPSRPVGTDIVAGDRDEPSAFGETRQRRAEMAHRRLGEAALDVRRGRKGRVHQHDARPDRRIEPVVDLLGVVPADRGLAKQPGEEAGARVGDLVEDEWHPRELGEDREHAGAGRGFEHQVGRGQHCRFGCHEAERQRCRELLKLLGFLRAAGVGCNPAGEPRQHLEHRGGRPGPRPHRAAEFAQEQHLRRLGRVVGVLPQPGAFGVGAAERGLHGGTERPAVDRSALPEQLREQGRGVDQARHLVGCGLRQEQRQRGRGGRRGSGGEHGISGSEGWKFRRALSRHPSGSPLSGHPLPLAAAGSAAAKKGPQSAGPGFREKTKAVAP